MADLDSFESMLKEVVSAKRLSASKIGKLTEIALKSMQNDTQLVSILYRTHKNLTPAAKIHSLYAFDALSRAARNQVTKQHLTGDINAEHGNAATFLLKVDGILDGLVQDMATLNHPEAKEKTKKILDIWTKSNTFPSAVIARLTELLKGSSRKDPEPVSSTVTRDPRQQHSTPPIITPPVITTPPQNLVLPSVPAPPPAIPTPESVQSTLLALLSQAANAVATTNGQTPTNTTVLPAQLDPSQLALFQQLTQTAKAAGNVPTQPVHLPVSLVPSATANAVPPVAPPLGGPSQPLPYRDDHFGSGHRDPKHDRYDGYDRGSRNRDDYYNDRRDFRGDFRGGPPRGSGFRGRGRGRRDDRERFAPREHERDWDPSRSVRSRSRSPGPLRGGRPFGGPGRRDDRLSPTQRPIATYTSDIPSDIPPRMPVITPDSGKDEFGRDIRPPSPDGSTPPALTHNVDVPSQSPQENGTAPVPYANGAVEKPPVPVEPTHTIPATTPTLPSASSSSPILPSQSSTTGGLNAIDMTTFILTDPSSWVALGTAWTETYGNIPSQDQLMQYVMTNMPGGGMGGYPAPDSYGSQPQGGQDNWSGQNQSWGYGGRGRGRGRGRGGYGYGNSRGGGGGQWGYSGGRDDFGGTDAITLGGGDDDSNAYNGAEPGNATWQDSGAHSHHNAQPVFNGNGDDSGSNHTSEGEVGRAGKMKRVGDKWVFVRKDSAALAGEVA